ncbi:EI24 domain-containing protein [Polyangium mundeleinium]|uniref:EI24 domain-containing protein n=1 Tax=Polyangium mundeleinium TaxID=2995306 RepID=A0ABT5F717_9BACT|nr:EI24 domain-containing protein [Polyangium mundeleinium]MDC0749424.1 EI24 domain-containing protein [Polyangium mundeleinium]
MITPDASPGVPAAPVQSPPAALVPFERPGFGAGLKAVLGGYGYLFRTPDLWPLALIPTGIALVLSIVLGISGVKLAPALVALIVKEPGTGALWTVLGVVLQVFSIVVMLVAALAVSFALAKPLSGPALERMVRRAEADMGAPTWPEVGLLDDMWRALQSSLVALAVTAPILILLGVLSFFFAPLSVVAFPLQLAVAALAGAWDLCDCPLSIRGVPVGARIEFVRRNIGAVMGFGLGLALLSFLPCTLLIVLPAGVLGAARLVVMLERYEAAGQQPR